MLAKVSLPYGIESTNFFATPWSTNQENPLAASVVRSPGAREPTVRILGANSLTNILFASNNLASNTGLGTPSNCAAPKTTIASLLTGSV